MNDKDEKEITNTDSGNSDVQKNPLVIFKTDVDKYGTDITMMSNFFDRYVQEMSLAIRNSEELQIVSGLPIADLGIIEDVINQAGIIMKGNTTLVADFDNLPPDIRTKFKKGIYSIGESRQVDGNLRAVILDENGRRVKNITLKKVMSNIGNIETMRSINNQLQIRQIYAKLSDIVEFQKYQIERDRDRDIIVPFLDARSRVLEAETEDSSEERIRMLKEADSKMLTALNSVYRDIKTTSENFAKRVNSPFLILGKQINTYMSYIANDLQIATKYVGVRMQILEYLGKREYAKKAFQDFNHKMLDFIEKPITEKGLSAAMLMQDYFPYNADNMDYWYKFAKEMKPAIKSSMRKLELGTKDFNEKEFYIVSVEDVVDE